MIYAIVAIFAFVLGSSLGGMGAAIMLGEHYEKKQKALNALLAALEKEFPNSGTLAFIRQMKP